MEILLKGSAFALTVTVLYEMVAGRNKETGVLLAALGSAMILLLAVSYIEPVIAFIKRLQAIGNLNYEMLGILIKCVGIGVLAEISVLVCNDMGNTSVGKSLQILAAALILWISLPLLNSLLDLVEEILGEI